MVKDNLPDTVDAEDKVLAVFTPPTDFITVDEGLANTVEFAQVGDSFTGIYQYTETITPDEGDPYPMASFTGVDGEPYVIFPGKGLRRGMRKLQPNDWARITYLGDLDTGKPSAMKCYRVEIAK
jgi:hypothetical protein